MPRKEEIEHFRLHMAAMQRDYLSGLGKDVADPIYSSLLVAPVDLEDMWGYLRRTVVDPTASKYLLGSHPTDILFDTEDAIELDVSNIWFNQNGDMLAFPGAEGFGALARGGRGGRVIEVTNLNDAGPGSYREAVEAMGPRIVVFRVGGTIELLSLLAYANPYITIAGQTAPGGGITIKCAPTHRYTASDIRTHDVVIRYLRVRRGAPSAGVVPTSNADAWLTYLKSGADEVYNIIFDHVSGSWATDGVMDIMGTSHDVTAQWSIFAEGLHNSTHPDGPHSTGPSVGGKTNRITLHHLLLAHNHSRNPRLASGLIDVRNIVVYDVGSANLISSSGDPEINFMDSFFKRVSSSYIHSFTMTSLGTHPQLYTAGNIWELPDGTRVVVGSQHVTRPEFMVSRPFAAPTVITTSAEQALADVLAFAGANRPRDPVDERIIRDVIDGTGRIIDDPSEVGGWPFLDPGVAPLDSDHDGMPDWWEVAHGLNPNGSPDDGQRSIAGIPSIEVYLDELARGLI